MSSTDESEGGSYQSSQLGSTVVIALMFALLLYSLYEMNRHMRRLYLQRRTSKLIDANRVPPVPPRHVFGWLVAIYHVSDLELLRMCGLDSYMLLQYAKFCFKVACFFTFTGLIIFVPVYAAANPGQDSAVQGWELYTLSNVPDNPHAYQLWAPAILMYVFAYYFCHNLNLLYNDFVDKRLQYLREGDPSTPQQTYYSVIVEGIPNSLRSAPKLKAYFESLFPDQVHSVQITLDLTELEKLVQRRRLVRNKLERAVACWKATGTRPECWLSPKDVEQAGPVGHAHVPLHRTPFFPRLFSNSLLGETYTDCYGRRKYDSIDHLSLELQQLNDIVSEMQTKFYSQTEEIRARDSEISHDQDESYGKVEMGLKRISKTIFPRRTGGGETNSTVIASLLDNDGLAPMRLNPAEDSKAEAAAVAEVKDTIPQRISHHHRHVHSIKHSVRNVAKGVLRSAANIERHIELLTVGAYYNIASTGFVTFTNRVAQSMAHQMLLSHDHFVMRAKPAPNPNDIIWPNMPVPEKQISFRKDMAGVGLAVGAMFWSVLVAFISGISNLQSLQETFPSLANYTTTYWYKFLGSYLTSLLLLICIAILPLIFDLMARKYEGLKLESEIQNSIMKRYFYYQLANVFVSVGLGSITGSLQEIIDTPRSIFVILGQNLPGFSIYFTNLLIVKTLTAVPLELLRTWPLILHLSLRMCLDEKKCSWRDLRSGVFAPPTLVYGWIYPSSLMVLMIITTYSTIAPLLMPFGMMYYLGVYCMYKYQILYVYINAYQSGGYMFYAVFRRSMVALLMATATLICYMAIRRSYVSGPFYVLLPLPLFIIRSWTVCEAKFKEHSQVLSLEGASKIDAQTNEAGTDPAEDFVEDLFLSPSLTEGELKPAPYRRPRTTAQSSSSNNNQGDYSIMEDRPMTLSVDGRSSHALLAPPGSPPHDTFQNDDPEGEVEFSTLMSDKFRSLISSSSSGGDVI